MTCISVPTKTALLGDSRQVVAQLAGCGGISGTSALQRDPMGMPRRTRIRIALYPYHSAAGPFGQNHQVRTAVAQVVFSGCTWLFGAVLALLGSVRQ
jgi:hypothetical protein